MNSTKKIFALIAALFLLAPGFFVFADSASPIPSTEQQVFDAAPAIPQAAAQGSPSSLGVGLWCAVLLLLAAGLIYLGVNLWKRRNLALSQSSLIRPKLIISEGGKKKLPKSLKKPK